MFHNKLLLLNNMNKISKNYDLLYSISLFLNFDDKIVLQILYKFNFIKNLDFMSKKMNLCNIDSICTECYEAYVYNQTLHLLKKFNKYYNYNDDDDYFSDVSLFIYETYMGVSNRAFLELCDSENRKIDIYKIECISKLNYSYNFYSQLKNRIDEIYEYGFSNKCLELFCCKCGLFGHNDTTIECKLYAENETIRKNEFSEVQWSLTSNDEDKIGII